MPLSFEGFLGTLFCLSGLIDGQWKKEYDIPEAWSGGKTRAGEKECLIWLKQM